MTDPIPESELSPAASARRASMKSELTETFTTHHRRRQGRRSALRASAAVIVVALLVQVLRPTTTNLPPDTPVDSPTAFPANRIVMIDTDPSILERLAPPPRHRVSRVNDDDLLATLASYGHDTGLIRRGDEVVLTRELLQ